MQTPDLLTITPILACAAAGAYIGARKLVTTVTIPMHHRSIHSRHGVFVKVLEPGRYRLFGSGHQFHHIDTRLQQLTIHTQEVTTAEGIAVKLTAAGLYRVVDPVRATSATTDYSGALYSLVQIALRDLACGVAIESLLANARSMGPQLLGAVRDKATDLGLEITELAVRDLILPADIKAAWSQTWRSKKASLAEIEAARGKAAAARTMANAAKIYDDHPVLMKLRQIDVLAQAAEKSGNTFVIGVPENTLPKTH